jgi:5-(carboxyamino)imidazole ribonucleotide mutase
MAAKGAPLVGVVMGSRSDLKWMKAAVEVLEEFNVTHEARVLSAHRTPDATIEWAGRARDRGMRVIIAGAGGAAHLAGVIAARTTLPVIGVPMPSTALGGLDALLAIVQMPKGVPVATVAIGEAGAANAALLAIEILALGDEGLCERLRKWREARARELLETKVE